MTEERVFTPFGIGRIIHVLPNGRIVVEFPHGDGHIFFREELFPNKDGKKKKKTRARINLENIRFIR